MRLVPGQPERVLEGLLAAPGELVAALAARVGYRSVLADFGGTIGYPEHQLSRAGVDRLLVAVVTFPVFVLAGERFETAERPLHDVTAGAESVVVLHVVPALRPRECAPRDDDPGAC